MLTYIQINAAKPKTKAWQLSDSQNLYLVVQPNGSKLWRFNYRFLNKQKKLHLGGWPAVSLAEARAPRRRQKEAYGRDRCGSAWKKDPGSGVIGVEKGPLIPVV